MAHLAEFFNNVRLPTMPEVARRLIRSLNEEDPEVKEVRDAIAQDPALTAKLLRLANSARFGFPRAVVSVDDAIVLAGLAQVRTLALATCLSETFPMVDGLNREVFWQESQACAGYAAWLAKAVNADSQEAWLAGFMLRLGELLIGQAQPKHLAEIERLPHFPGGRWERENELLGLTEGQITAELARRWNFPENIALGLEKSADPLGTRPFCRLAALVHVAELLAEMACEGESDIDMISELPQEVLGALQMDNDWLREHLPAPEEFVASSAVH